MVFIHWKFTLGTITTGLTAFYSVRLLSLVFFTNEKCLNKKKVNSVYLDSYNDTIQSKTKKEGKIVVVTNIETNILK